MGEIEITGGIITISTIFLTLISRLYLKEESRIEVKDLNISSPVTINIIIIVLIHIAITAQIREQQPRIQMETFSYGFLSFLILFLIAKLAFLRFFGWTEKEKSINGTLKIEKDLKWNIVLISVIVSIALLNYVVDALKF